MTGVITAVAAAGLVGGIVAVLAGWGMRAGLRRARSLRRQILAIAVASLAGGAAVALVLARLMVLDADQARTAMAVLAATAGCATVLVVAASAPLGRDVRRLETTVRAMEAGDRSIRSGIDRRDELGHVATALDDAIGRLEVLERERAEEDERRRALFSSIGHDLRTPLAALQAALEAMEDGVTPDPGRYLRAMQRDVEALTSLVDDLFLLTRIESGALEMSRASVDLAEIVDEAAEALAPVAEARGVTIRLDVCDRALVQGNATALGRVVRNLLDNAIRHSPSGAVVVVDVTDDGRPTVRVLDEGDGFPPGFADEAFKRFSRADASRSRATGGSGLGLAIARGLVEAHGGDIWIEDAPGGRVAFALPASG